jgi:SAM-dependent methyltransferase
VTDIKCPICANTEITKKYHKKSPSEFGFKDFEEYTIFSCSRCDAEFAYPRKPLEYDKINTEYKVYSKFALKENREGQIFHTVNCTSHWKDSPIVHNILNGALPLYGSQANLLDFGAGSGYMTELARRLGYKVSALEACEEFREFIQETIPGVTVYRSIDDIKTKFDVIYAMHVMEHLPYPIEILSKLNLLLSERGILIIVVPNLDRAFYKFNEIGCELEDQMDWDGIAGDFPPHHLTRFRGQTLREALRESKFKQIAIGYSLVNAWDLFYTGLGDQAFKFKDYSKDISQMKTISAVENNLNIMLSYLGLDNLGYSLIALTSNIIPSNTMDDLICQSREEVMRQYANTMSLQYDQFQDSKRNEDFFKDKHFHELEAENKRLVAENERLDTEVLSIKNSKSWKFTQPLRWLFFRCRSVFK